MVLATNSDSEEHLHLTFASRYVRAVVPRFKMPENSMPKDAAYQVINDELMLDGNPRLNIASFVTTWMEPECDKLIMDSVNKNYVDMDEYPVTTELQNRCVNMIANLFHAPVGEDEAAIGCGTVGSSEAIMLAGLAFKSKWQQRRKAQGLSTHNPNIVTGADVQREYDVPTVSNREDGELICGYLNHLRSAMTLTVCPYLLQAIQENENPVHLLRPVETQHLILRTKLHPKEFRGISMLLNNCPDLKTLTFDILPPSPSPTCSTYRGIDPQTYWIEKVKGI